MQGARSGLAMGGKVIFKQALLYILNLIDHPSNEQEWPAGTPFKVLLINATCVTASVTVSTKRVAQGGFDPPSSRLWAWHANHCATELLYYKFVVIVYIQNIVKKYCHKFRY